MSTLLSIEELSIDFVSGNRTIAAVSNISLQINKGEIVALVGESGSGKSVTSLSVLQLLPSTVTKIRGRINFVMGQNTIDLLSLQPKQLQQIRGNKISMIFQEPMTSLNPVMSCGKQVQEALLIHKKISSTEARKRTIEWFRKVQLPQPELLFHKYPHELSGGQKQRVMIAMAMCCHPSLLICDEPTTALDVTVQKTILELIRDLQQQEQMGVLFITHDLGVVSEIANQVAILYKGSIVEQNTVASIFKNPQHPYTRALIACRPALHTKGQRLPTVEEFLNEDFKYPTTTVADTAHKPSVLVQIDRLCVQFPKKKNFLGKTLQYTNAVDDVSFEINKGETLGLVGESGCGKTTLGRTLLKLVKPSSGRILYNGIDITNLKENKIKEFRKQVQLVFQDPYSSLNPRLTIGDAITEPIKNNNILKEPKLQRKRVRELLNLVQLPENSTERYPHEFSGGQRQRIVIARALSLNPGFLVCDESVSALDVSVQAQILNLLNDLKKDLNLTMLFISHDLSVIRYMCDRIMVMNKGKIVESGTGEEVYLHPKSAYTKQLIDAIPNL